MFYNLGGIAFTEKRDFYAGISLIFLGDSTYQGVAPIPSTVTGEQVSQLEIPPHFYWVEPISERLKFGLALNAPFGLVTEWEDPDTWAGRFISQKADLLSIDLNPSVAYKINDRLGVAVGLIVRFSEVELRNITPTPTIPPQNAIQNVLESDLETGFGGNFGLLFKATEQFSLGFSYRSKVDIDYSGEATFTPILAPGAPPPTGIETSIEFPDQAVLGFSYLFGSKWTANLDIVYTGWSSFDQLVIDFDPGSMLPQVVRPQNWDDAYSVRGGAEYKLGGSSRIRFGLYFDETPQPEETVSPLLPDADRMGYSVGYGYDGSSIDVDAYFLYVDFDERTTTTNLDGFNGTYETDVLILGASVRF
jgi:long-chain fatty acid transport protein